MSKLRLYNYNNYINRIFKKENSLADYGTPIYTLSVTNFNYNDGVDTSHVINYNNQDGDYVIITDDNDNIQSRWFVTENVRNRGGQHNLTLKRDLKVDLYDLYKDSPMIVHRGWITDSNSPLLFNSEGFNYNQIKKDEILLTDETRIPWYVVYMAKNSPKKTSTISIGDAKPIYKEINTPIASSIYGEGTINSFSNQKYIINCLDSRYAAYSNYYRSLKFSLGSNGESNSQSTMPKLTSVIWFENPIEDIIGTLTHYFREETNTWPIINNLDTEHKDTTYTQSELQELLNSNGKFIKDSLNKVYYISVTKNTNSFEEEYTLNSNVTDYMKGVINGTGLERDGDWGSKAFGISYDKDTYTVSYTLDETNTIGWEVDFSTKIKSNDAGYNIIAFPAGKVCATGVHGDLFMDKDIADKFLVSLLGEYDTSYIYDVQLLPYCPIQAGIDSFDPDYNCVVLPVVDIWGDDRIIPQEISYNVPSGPITPNETPCLLFYYIKNSTFTFNINKTLERYRINPYYVNDTKVLKKINNECNVYRLCSPNYNGQFEFSVVKNNGVDYFNVDITLRPYNPYIHINPNFKGIYGQDFDDARGLICQGDFSVPLVSDQFKQYELQHKNYLNVFNRQIENMDFNFEQERIKGVFGAVAGGVVGGIGGGVSGYKIGAGVGAGVGAALGGIGSAVGGIIDYNMLTSRQEEQKDFAIDNFRYQLGNIKALPYSLTKVTPFTANNKIFPFIEIFSATDEEIEILYNKIIFNSFVVEKIGNITQFRDPGNKRFFSATLIRIEGANQPTHELQELARELEKGVYI